MSQKQKLVERFCKIPPPKDFHWNELVTVMKHFQFSLREPSGGSSHKCFESDTHPDRYIDVSRPHPNGILHLYQVREIKAKLLEWKLIK